MAAHVADAAVAEVPPLLPAHAAAAVVRGVIGALGRGAEPEVPVEPLGGLEVGVGGGRLGVGAAAAAPDVALFDGADGAALDQLDDAAVVGLGVNLRALLGGELAVGLEHGFAQGAGLVDGVGDRLLAVDVFAELERVVAHERVRVVGGRADDGVEVLRVVHQPSPVGVDLGLGEAAPGAGHGDGLAVGPLALGVLEHAGVDVAEGDDVLARAAAEVGAAAAADADDGEVELVAGRLGAEDAAAQDHQAGAAEGRVLEKVASRGAVFHRLLLNRLPRGFWARAAPAS